MKFYPVTTKLFHSNRQADSQPGRQTWQI